MLTRRRIASSEDEQSSRTTSNRRLQSNTRGLFENGVWLCDCKPRIPAEHFQVRKDGKNKGKWFYTCQKTEQLRCGFFLWEDDAAGRMKQAVLGNSRTELKKKSEASCIDSEKSPAQVTKSERKEGRTQNQPSISPPQTPKARSKRRLPWKDRIEDSVSTVTGAVNDSLSTLDEEENDSDNFEWSLDDEEEVWLTEAVQNRAETPRKAVRFNDTVITPHQNKVRGSNGLLTPGTTPQISRTAAKSDATLQTPTPSRFVDALSRTSDLPRIGDDDASTLTSEVMDLVSSSKPTLNAEQQELLTAMLDKHSMRYQGVIRGREKTRQAVTIRDAKIVKLQQQIVGLQGEVQSAKTLVKHLRRTSENRNETSNRN